MERLGISAEFWGFATARDKLRDAAEHRGVHRHVSADRIPAKIVRQHSWFGGGERV